jgi:hypothetical protein
MGPTLEESARAKIAKYLPDAVEHALQSYREFSAQIIVPNADKDKITSKDFSAHHMACKTAIAHLELLLKLAVLAQLPRDEDENLSVLMADAQAELDRHNAEEGSDEC